ncbi:hypothetical protein O181_082532 [Austropuccinia psidii MF-1]|uniref:Uncharacterized protein n=1 Tax=Austropuccinia psidii MF-1 TaxID=1389203 RepID=A0A9Q3IJB0_9BASI|nr:hypothetical protein [Austropuccinia psidii MF-1]
MQSHINADGHWIMSRATQRMYDPGVEAKIPIHFFEIDRKKNFRFSGWAPEGGTPDSEDAESEGAGAHTLGISA